MTFTVVGQWEVNEIDPSRTPLVIGGGVNDYRLLRSIGLDIGRGDRAVEVDAHTPIMFIGPEQFAQWVRGGGNGAGASGGVSASGWIDDQLDGNIGVSGVLGGHWCMHLGRPYEQAQRMGGKVWSESMKRRLAAWKLSPWNVVGVRCVRCGRAVGSVGCEEGRGVHDARLVCWCSGCEGEMLKVAKGWERIKNGGNGRREVRTRTRGRQDATLI